MKITEAELLEALRAAARPSAKNPEGAMTAFEIGIQLDLSHKTTLDYLKRAKAAGQIEVVKVMRAGLDDRVCPVTAYRFKKGKKAA